MDLINALYVTRRVSLSAPQLLLERVLIMLSLFMQDSFKVFRCGAQDNFLSKIWPSILMLSVNCILRLLRYSLGEGLSLVFLVNRMPWVFLGENFKPVVFY